MSAHPLDELLRPESVAIAGASENKRSWGYSYTRHLIDYGFRGDIYPVNPRHETVLGLKAYPSLLDIPGSVDYVISCIPASEVLKLVAECAQKNVKVIQLFTARFSETGHKEAADLEQELLKQARKAGIRLIGPNCMGVYYPAHGLSIGFELPEDSGPVGMLSQSGGGASGFIHMAAKRGVRFSKVISYGNALDLNECDYLDYFAWDPETGIIAIYIEGTREGPRFFEVLRRAASQKPVIILKGGRGRAGTRSVVSHTASLAGSVSVWKTLIAQTGAIPAESFDEMADMVTAFRFCPPINGLRVGVVGGNGGPSVLSADLCEEAGLEVIPLPVEVQDQLKERGLKLWDWIDNPVDSSTTGGFGVTDIDMLRMMGASKNFDLMIGMINEGVVVTLREDDFLISRIKNSVAGYIKVRQEFSKPLLAVVADESSGSDRYGNLLGRLISEMRTSLINGEVPVFPTVGRAARAARRVSDYYTRRSA